MGVNSRVGGRVGNDFVFGYMKLKMSFGFPGGSDKVNNL